MSEVYVIFIFYAIKSGEIVIENIRLVSLQDLTADLGSKANAKLTPIFKLGEKSKTGIQSCLYTVTVTHFLTYIL